ncbi:FecR family protein [Allomuricauda sp. NBRC 101325]|uniref:FecR family protein n=1 Tax=Allomuricauda sp. NBRC 101325 TaxID=1113758 RepID=UPI0024A31F28|nr:FecR domain-containing protein [Muricauda sp. NBRC 101325]GLU45594.1 anti-sigma factor [Muricauda sp. NBRC 101325]
MTENEIKGLMEKYLNGTISKKEESLLENFDSSLLRKNSTTLFKSDRQKAKIARSILGSIQHVKKSNPVLRWTKVAASIALLIGIGYATFLSTKQEIPSEPIVEITKTTEWGQKLNITLSDGSQIRLNAGSSLKYPSKFDGDERIVELTGEAFFDVTKKPEKPFIIKSGEVETTVLGTSFNVNTYPENDEIAVTVATGMVKVASQENEVYLLPNEQGVFNKSSKNMTKQQVDISYALHWKDGILHFEDTDLNQVLERLEKWYGVSFQMENKQIGNCHITATFINQNLTEVMESIVFTKKGLKYQFLNDKTILLKGICTD